MPTSLHQSGTLLSLCAHSLQTCDGLLVLGLLCRVGSPLMQEALQDAPGCQDLGACQCRLADCRRELGLGSFQGVVGLLLHKIRTCHGGPQGAGLNPSACALQAVLGKAHTRQVAQVLG